MKYVVDLKGRERVQLWSMEFSGMQYAMTDVMKKKITSTLLSTLPDLSLL